MEPGLTDTDPETERVHLEMLWRASPEEIGLRFVALPYGRELAEDVKQCLAARRQ